MDSFSPAAAAATRAEVGDAIAALKACKLSRDLQAGKAIHLSLSESLKKNQFVSNSLVDMYAKCGSMVEAWWTFQSMSQPDTVSWNSIIQGYALNGYPDLALRAYSQMLQLGFIENRGSYLAALKACSTAAGKDQAWAHQRVKFIHLRAARAGVDVELVLANTLIDAYARCGSCGEACRVFETMQEVDVVTWSCTISAFAQSGDAELAFELFERMHLEGFRGDRATFLAALKACDAALVAGCSPGQRIKCSRMIEMVHKRAQAAGELQVPVANMLISVYAKCGQMTQSRRLFESMQQRTIVSWTSIILGHVEAGECGEALDLFVKMLTSGECVPDAVCQVAALKACAGLRLLEFGKALHAQVNRAGTDRNEVVATSLAEMYTKCGSLEDARRVAENGPELDVFAWTYMILGLCEAGDYEAALQLYTSLARDHGERLDRVTLLAALKACGALAESHKLQALEHCVSIHQRSKLLRIPVEDDLLLASSLVDTYAKCGALAEAGIVLWSMKRRNSVTWSCMALGFAENGDFSAALETYFGARSEGALHSVTFAAAFKSCGSLVSLEVGQKIYGDALRVLGLESLSGAAVGALIDMYAKCGRMADAQRVFDSFSLDSECLAAWNALMVGYSCQGDTRKVLSFYESMREERVPVDGIVITSVLAACSHAGLVDTGMSFFRRMLASCERPGAQHYACVIDMLGRADRLDDAVELLEKLEAEAVQKEEVLWTALLDACCKSKNSSLAGTAFARLQRLNKGSSFVQMSNMLASQAG